MIFLIISIIILGISLFVFVLISKQKVSLDEEKKLKQRLDSQIKELQKDYQSAKGDLSKINDVIKQQQSQSGILKSQIEQKKQTNNQLINSINKIRQQMNTYYDQEKKRVQRELEEFKQTSGKAAQAYWDNLEGYYETAEARTREKLASLKEEQNKAAADLNNLKETRKAAYEAILRQKEVKENKDDYRLKPSEVDLYDIRSLKHLSKTFHKPRVISMLIWQYYFQPLAKKQFPIILKGSTKMGIYKITDLFTDQAYIGQSVDIYKRWTDHCKAGLGIDTPVGNRLYQKMGSDGLQNFTFELLCQCSKEQLDEKERYFIELYQADLYGFNGTKGNKT